MANRAEGVRVAYPLFQAGGGGSNPTSALQLRVEVIPYPAAQTLNALWHSRLPRIGDPQRLMTAGICFGAEFGGLWYAAAIWSHPVNRKLPQTEWLELRRLAVAPDAPRNTASRMLAVMARLVRGLRPEIARLVSYQDTEVHNGGIYRAAGWTPTVLSKHSPWNKPNSRNLNGRPRVRPADQSTAPKRRWEKVLHGGHPMDRVAPARAEANVPLPDLFGDLREGDPG